MDARLNGRGRHVGGVMIGRERELGRAREFLREAAARSGRLVLAGEAGIGKSTIWATVVEEAVALGFCVLPARPSQAEADLPFAVLSDVFAQVDEGELGKLPDVQRAALERALRRRSSSPLVDPTAVALATLGVLRTLAGSCPTLVAIDDLQWVDTPSLRALAFAFRRAGDETLGLVATVRTGFDTELTTPAAGDAISTVLLEIAGLGDRQLAELVRERTGRMLSALQLAELARLSGGNPFHALELAAVANEGSRLPETLAAALRTRLSTLSPAARSAGLVAATLGRVDEPLVRRLHGSGLDELWASGIVDHRPAGPWFAHPLLASALLEMSTPAERRAVHLSLAAALEDPDERALHLGRATEAPSEAVAAELEEAAGRLDMRGAPETAAVLAERAAALTPDAEAGARTRRLVKAADLYSAAGDGRTHVLPLLERLAETLPHGADRARVLVRLGWLGAQLGAITTGDTVDYLERAVAESDGDADVTTAANAALARMRGIGGGHLVALHHAELAVMAGAEPDGMFPSPFGELGAAKFFAGRGLDEEAFERGIAVESRLVRVGEPYQSPRLQYALALLNTGELSRARRLLDDLLAQAVDFGRVRSIAGCLLHLVQLEVRAGELRRAEEHATEFAHLDQQLREEPTALWYPSGLVALHLGRVEDARRILNDGVEDARRIESTTWLAHNLEALGLLELSLGNLAAARQALGSLPERLRETGFGEWSVHPFHPDLIEALVGLGELDEAGELTAELEEYAQRLDRPWGLATAARSRALLHVARGEDEEAFEAAQQALAEHERLEWPYEHARTLLVNGVILRRLGRRRDAASTLGEARAIFGSLGNPLWLARVEAEAGRLGGRRGTADELTPTESRVAELAGQGLRNAEIAARLYVTPKTVEATLSRVYRKLGVRSRTELARRMSPRDDVPEQTPA